MNSIAICIGAGSAPRSAGASVGPTPLVNVTVDGEIEIVAVDGALTVTISEPGQFAGTYSLDVSGGPLHAAALSAGPQCLVAPRIELTGDADVSSSVSVGDTVGIGGAPLATSHPGLWLYDSANGTPVIGYQWQADARGDADFVDIPGETSALHVLTADDAGDRVRLTETATDSGGSRTAASTVLSVDPLPSAFEFTDVGDTGLTGSTVAGPFTVAALDFGPADADREIWAAVAAPTQSINGPAITGVTIAGVAATKVAGTTSPAGFGYTEIWKAPVPTGTSGDVRVETATSAYGAIAAVYRSIGMRRTTTPASEVSVSAASAGASIATGPGQIVLTVAWNFNGLGLGFSGATPDFAAFDFRSGDYFGTATHPAVAAETPRAISASAPASATIFNILSITIEDAV